MTKPEVALRLRRGAGGYSRSGYDSTPTAFARDDLFRPAVLDVFEFASSTEVRFSSRRRMIGRLCQKRDAASGRRE
jgi:hypothetical protein